MSDTEQLFILAGFWTAGALILAYFIPSWWAKIAAVALLVGIPFWELPFGYMNFRRLCEGQGGLRVIESVTPQHTVCAIYPLESSASRLLELGFATVEAKDQLGHVWILSKDSKRQSESANVSSAYCITQSFAKGLPWRIQRNEHTVIRVADEHRVAQFNDFVWFGTWWQEQALPVLGRGGECRHGDALRAIAAVLVKRTQ